MKLIERYIFGRLLKAFLLTELTVAVSVWMIQAMNQFDLITAQGQSAFVFLRITVLLVPDLMTLVTPVALLIAVIYSFNALNRDSELVVINACGARQMAFLRPVLILSALAALFISSMTLYLVPFAQRSWRTAITDVRADVATAVLREGRFMKLADGITVHLRNRNPDGSLQGIFVSDDRDPSVAVTYLAKEGVVLHNVVGSFMIMNDGTIQRRSKTNGAISIIQFSSYAFDLSSLASQTDMPAYRPEEQPTSYLFNPDPKDPVYQNAPGRFRSELNGRLSEPFYAFAFALLPLIFLTQPESTRQGRVLTITLAVTAATIIRLGGSISQSLSKESLIAGVLAYGLPIGVSLIAGLFILRGFRPRVPQRLSDSIDAIVERLGERFQMSAGAPAGGS
jgi:lipopolysaccharide export system permease protein